MEKEERVNKKLVIIAIFLIIILGIIFIIRFGGKSENENYNYEEIKLDSTNIEVEYTEKELTRRMGRLYSKNNFK